MLSSFLVPRSDSLAQKTENKLLMTEFWQQDLLSFLILQGPVLYFTPFIRKELWHFTTKHPVENLQRNGFFRNNVLRVACGDGAPW